MGKEILDYIFKNNIHLVVLYILFGILAYEIISSIMNKSTKRIRNNHQKTVHKLLQNAVKYVIMILVVIAVLNALGINVTSLVAGVGIASIVIGLALQDTMTDILAGISMILDDQFNVGDYVEINGFEGTITEVGLKSTKIRDYKNVVKVMSNRTITSVTNYSKKDPKITIDIPIPYDVDNKKADKVIENIKNRIDKEIEFLTEETIVFGLNNFEESHIEYRLLVSTKKDMQFAAKRKANRIIKEEFDKAKISIPFNIIEVKNG